MDGHIVVRKAELKDADRITCLNIWLARETEYKELDKTVVSKGVKALLKDSSKGFYIVAEKASKPFMIVGQLLITFEWSEWRNKYFWWVQSVYVDKEYRNQKIFSTLFKYVIKLAASEKDVYGLRLYVEKNNECAKLIYESLGMKQAPYVVYELGLGP